MISNCTITSSCEIDGNYRHWLRRSWDSKKKHGVFIALNPSKADHLVCDPTMCNMNNLALKWQWGGFYILNLFAYMATDRDLMLAHAAPIGPRNDDVIRTICESDEPIVLSWGREDRKLIGDRSKAVKQLLRSINRSNCCCLDVSKNNDGYQHPCVIDITEYPYPKPITI